MKQSQLEQTFAYQMRVAKVEAPTPELVFHPTRKWRFDFAWPDRMIAVEVEGATWTGGRHTRGSGFEADAEKYGAAAVLGWRVIRVTGDMVNDGRALNLIEQALAA